MTIHLGEEIISCSIFFSGWFRKLHRIVYFSAINLIMIISSSGKKKHFYCMAIDGFSKKILHHFQILEVQSSIRHTSKIYNCGNSLILLYQQPMYHHNIVNWCYICITYIWHVSQNLPCNPPKIASFIFCIVALL